MSQQHRQQHHHPPPPPPSVPGPAAGTAYQPWEVPHGGSMYADREEMMMMESRAGGVRVPLPSMQFPSPRGPSSYAPMSMSGARYYEATSPHSAPAAAPMGPRRPTFYHYRPGGSVQSNRRRPPVNPATQWISDFNEKLQTWHGGPVEVTYEAVLGVLAPLGDPRLRNTLGMSETAAVLAVAAGLQQQIFGIQPSRLLALAADPNHPHSATLVVVSRAIVECSSHLVDRLSILASVLAVAVEQTARLPEGITAEDVQLAENDADALPVEKAAHVSLSSAKVRVGNRLIALVASEAINRLSEHLNCARVEEAKNVARFLVELANLQLIAPETVLTTVLTPLVIVAERMRQGDVSLVIGNDIKVDGDEDNKIMSSDENKNVSSDGGVGERNLMSATPIDKNLLALFADALVRLIVGVLPWFSVETCNRLGDGFSEFRALVDEFAKSRIQPPLTEGLSPVFGAGQDYLTRGVDALRTLAEEANWLPKVLFRIYKSSAEMRVIFDSKNTYPHNPLSQQLLVLEPLQFNPAMFVRRAMDNRQRAMNISLNAGPLGGSLTRTGVYADDAVTAGVGGGTVGLNGIWAPRCHLRLWTDEELLKEGGDLLRGVEPLAEHNKWLLEELFLSTLHAFRHSVTLCAEMLLTVHVAYDQMEISLVETVLNEMLQLPHSADRSLFYYRLLDLLARKQSTVKPIIESALLQLIKVADRWDFQTSHTLADFYGFYLSTLPGGVASCGVLKTLAQQVPQLARQSLEPTVIDLTERARAVEENPLPLGVKAFLSAAFERLARLLWVGNFAQHIPAELQCFVPAEAEFQPKCAWHKALAEKAQNESSDVERSTGPEPASGPVEFELLHRLMVLRVDETVPAHGQLMNWRLFYLMTNKLLDRPKLAKLPSTQYIEKMTSAIMDLKTDIKGNIGTQSVGPASSGTVPNAGNGSIIKPEMVDVMDDSDKTEGNSEGSAPAAVIKPELVETSAGEGSSSDANMNSSDGPASVKPEVGAGGNEAAATASVKPGLSERSIEEQARADVGAEEFEYLPVERCVERWDYLALTDLLIRVMLSKGSRSLSHTTRVFELYAELLRLWRPSEEKVQNSVVIKSDNCSVDDGSYYAAVLKTIFSFYNSASLKPTYSVLQLLKHKLIPPTEVNRCCFDVLPLHQLLNNQLLWRTQVEMITRILVCDDSKMLLARTLDVHRSIFECLEGFIRRSQRFVATDAAVVDVEEGEEADQVPQSNGPDAGAVGASSAADFTRRRFLRMMRSFARTFLPYADVERLAPSGDEEIKVVESLKVLKAYLYSNALQISGHKVEETIDMTDV